MKTFKDLPDIKGKKILLRVDFNVSVQGGVILDPFRIKKTIPTIEALRQKGAHVILISHYKGKEGNSLLPIAAYLRTFFPLSFVPDIFSDEAREIVLKMKNADVVLFENLRKWEGEEKNDPAFAKHLASFAPIYINEAFSASHRQHASIVGVSKIIRGVAGILFEKEIEHLSKAFKPERPFLFILGGAKFGTKLPLLEKFLDKADDVFVAGALMNNFYKELGYEVGTSLVEDGDFNISYMLKQKNLLLPSDVVVSGSHGDVEVKDADKVLPNEHIQDVGPDSLIMLTERIKKAKFILWNGPLGNYEKGFSEGTSELAHRIAESLKESIIGGGDTLTVVSKLHLEDKFSFISTAGGAMLDFLANETLPGIEALK